MSATKPAMKSPVYLLYTVVICLNIGSMAMSSQAIAASDNHDHMGHHENMDHGKVSNPHNEHADHNLQAEHADHSKHQAMMKSTKVSKSVADYKIPDLALVNKAGEKVSVIDVLSPDKPILLNFIFTTCTTICPVMSATFSQTQKLLGSDRENVQMVSISIDPEQDTPEKLRAYAKKFNANNQWHFLTGNVDDIVTVLQAFDAYRGSKMNHIPVTLMRKTKHDPWIRIEGLTTAQDLVGEYRQLTSS